MTQRVGTGQECVRLPLKGKQDQENAEAFRSEQSFVYVLKAVLNFNYFKNILMWDL